MHALFLFRPFFELIVEGRGKIIQTVFIFIGGELLFFRRHRAEIKTAFRAKAAFPFKGGSAIRAMFRFLRKPPSNKSKSLPPTHFRGNKKGFFCNRAERRKIE